ncbi:MAG: AAA family ATPase [Desulfobacteraceae bacterium]|nr:AAA family ATPase [Desulfobacteraceae bacterium]
MYLDFYGLNEKPFSLTPDTRFLYLSENHQGATNHLLYGIREKEGFVVLTGEIGTGKTTIVRALVERLGKDTSSALLLNPMLEGEELLRCILEEFGIGDTGGLRKELIDRLNQFLLGELTQARGAVLIIDEAQHLSEQALEEIRLLSNLETEKVKLLQIILVGQVELDQKLKSSFLRALNQRISIRYHLLPLSRTDTEKFIYHRLLVAGSNGNITFSASALNKIFKYSQGIPRLIDLVCDRTLLAGYAGQSNRLDKKMVKRGIESLGKQGVSSANSSKIRTFFSLGVLAGLLGCIYLIGFQYEIPYSTFLNANFIHKDTSRTGQLILYPIHNNSTDKGTSLSPESISSSPESLSPSPESISSSHLYSIQISSYRDNTKASMNVNQLQKLGYEAFTTKVDIPGKGIWYGVMFGKFQSKGEAQAMLKKIKALKGFPGARIISAWEDMEGGDRG